MAVAVLEGEKTVERSIRRKREKKKAEHLHSRRSSFVLGNRRQNLGGKREREGSENSPLSSSAERKKKSKKQKTKKLVAF
jgi:hypothetical protein